jgi:hypothetical protein
MTLRDKIAAVEEQMRAKLAEIRATLRHAGGKGQQVEEAIRSFLREYLPRRLGVGHGEVIDASGGRSPQTDIVIVTDDHPFTFPRDLPGLFFIEGVCGAGEVKTVVDKPELADAFEKARRFKALRAQRAPGTLFAGNASDRDRFYTSPAYFLVAIESKVSLEAVATQLAEKGRYGAAGYPGGIDGVFLLDRGWAIDFGDGTGSLQFRRPTGESAAGWVFHESSSVLFDFLGWLSSVMLRTLRFEPIMPPYLVDEWPKS